MPCAEVGRLEKATRRDSARRNTDILQGFRQIRTACTNPPGSPKKGDPTPFNKGVFGAGKQFDKFLFTLIGTVRDDSLFYDQSRER